MHARERRSHARDNNRVVRPFEWGQSYVADHVNGDDPRQLLRRYSEQAMQNSEEFYALPPILIFYALRRYVTAALTVG